MENGQAFQEIIKHILYDSCSVDKWTVSEETLNLIPAMVQLK